MTLSDLTRTVSNAALSLKTYLRSKIRIHSHQKFSARHALMLGAASAVAVAIAETKAVAAGTIPPSALAVPTLWVTYTNISSITIPSVMLAFRTNGYTTQGDGGDALLIAGTSLGPKATQDAAGRYFELARTGVWTSLSWGLIGDGIVDNTTPGNAWLAACVTYGQDAFALPGNYVNSGLTLDCSGGSANAIKLYGTHAARTTFTLSNSASSSTDHLTIITGAGYGLNAMAIVSNITLDGVFFRGRHGINCQSAWDGTASDVKQAAIIENVTIKFPGKDGVYGTTVSNYHGLLINVWVTHPGRFGFNYNSSNWQTYACKCTNADQAGKRVTGAINNGSGLIRLTVPNHNLTTSQTAYVMNVNGVPAATGSWVVTVIDSSTIDLQGSTFSGTFNAIGNAGVCVGVWTISALADNGSGSIRVTTSTNHAFSVGDGVFLRNCGGAPNANGGWLVSAVPAANQVDLDVGELLWAEGWTSALNGQIYTSGGTIHPFTSGQFFGTYAQGPGGCLSNQTELWNCFMGLVVTCQSADPMQFLQADIFNNFLEGITVQTFGFSPMHSFSGRMAKNSLLKTGTFSDILLSNTGGLSFNMTHVNMGTQVAYLMESDATVVTNIFFNPIIDLTNAHNAFSVNMTNFSDTAHSTANVPLGIGSSIASGTGCQANRYADAAGRNNNASGQYSFVRGNTNTVSGQYSAAFGVQGNDRGIVGSLIYGGTLFSAQGDNQVRLAVVASAITTGATPVRLLTGGNNNGATSATTLNCMNLTVNYTVAKYPRLVIICKKPGTVSTKTWYVDNLTVERNNGAATLLVNGSGVTAVTPTNDYTSADAALAACTITIQADTTNAGLNITATGIAATTLHWHISGSTPEVA